MVDNDSIPKNLPEDLIYTEIFSRLPTKLVGRFRCLSKTWRTRLSSSDFINLHLTRKPHQEHSISVSGRRSLHLITCSKSTHSAQKIQLRKTWSRILGSCNGLVMLMDRQDTMYLLNPITMQHIKVPISTFVWKKHNWVSMYGFGYDSSTDDYEVVKLLYARDCREISVELYSFRRCVWKRLLVDNYPYQHHGFVESLCFVNGAMHWAATDLQSQSRVIVAFDLANEVFHEIPMPTNSYYGHELLILRGCLSAMVYIRNCSQYLDIWMMIEYGVVDSWTKFISIDIPMWCVISSFVNSDDEFVLGQYWDCNSVLTSLVLCNMKERSTRNIIIDGLPIFKFKYCEESFRHGYSFVDSLVSPNRLTGSGTCQYVEERIKWPDCYKQ